MAHPLLTRYNFWTRYTPVIIFGYCTFVSKNKINWEKLFEYARESELDNALYYTLYHCQLIFGNIIPNDIYVTWDMQKVKEISNTIYDRWFTRNTLIPVGKWTTDFMERVLMMIERMKRYFLFIMIILTKCCSLVAILKL